MLGITIQNINIEGVFTPVRTSSPTGGEHNQEAVVFVHGNPGSSEDWLTFLPQVGQFARVIAPDMPGYGKADRPRDFNYTVEGYAQHLALILAALNIKKVHLVLHDFGGCWGLQFASDYPEKVASITEINAGVVPGYRWHTFARIWRTPIIGELFQLLASRWAFRFLLNRGNPKPFPVEFTDRMFDDSDWGLTRGMLRLYRSTPDMASLSIRLAESLRAWKIPVLVLWGEDDRYLSAKYAHQQKDYFDAQVHILPGCGHWPMIDDPKRVTALLIPFLQKQCLRT